LAILARILAAAALAWATESGISFGATHVPAIKIPSVVVATGSVDSSLSLGTTHNNAPINMSVKRAAIDLIKDGKYDQGLINKIEMCYRAYDPCLSCATHDLDGRLAVKINIVDNKGELLDTLKNF